MKLLEAAAALFFALLVGAVLALGYLVWRMIEMIIAAIPPQAWLAAGGAALFAVVLVVVGGAVVLVRWLARRASLVHPDRHTALYPQVRIDRLRYLDLNEPHSQQLAALAAGGRRPTAALVGRVLAEPPAPADQPAPQQIAAPAALTVQDVVDVDPRTRPHWLLIGGTGSGKTVAAYSILAELSRRAACHFVIAEPGGVNWGSQATATTTPEIARAIGQARDEMIRRQELLRLENADHVADLAEPLPYLVLVAEETESILDDLRLTDRTARDETVIALRAIARMGRKAGVILVAITQAGSGDVFDMHVRKNVGNVLLFRSEHTVGETWRVSRDIRLADLPVGAAYSVAHGAVVQFPRVARPALPTAQPLRVADGIAVSNWPTTAVVDGCDGAPVARLEPGREPDAETAAQLRRLHAAGWSKTRLCLETWGYKDGVVWRALDRALRGEL